jgi:hypothetical protein
MEIPSEWSPTIRNTSSPHLNISVLISDLFQQPSLSSRDRHSADSTTFPHFPKCFQPRLKSLRRQRLLEKRYIYSCLPSAILNLQLNSKIHYLRQTPPNTTPVPPILQNTNLLTERLHQIPNSSHPEQARRGRRHNNHRSKWRNFRPPNPSASPFLPSPLFPPLSPTPN